MLRNEIYEVATSETTLSSLQDYYYFIYFIHDLLQ